MMTALADTAHALVKPGKGLLASDESTGSLTKQFEAIGLASTEDNRRDWRELLFTTREPMQDYISGVILFDETIRQKARAGGRLADLICAAGAIPGIKLDKGTTPLPFTDGELITEGLDGLAPRIREYVELGAKFAKWRAVINPVKGKHSGTGVRANAQALARYAALCQAGGLVPIVEPELLMDGDNDMDSCMAMTERVLRETFAELFQARVALEGIVLKPNMVVPGKKSGQKASREEVAEKTIAVLKRCVPPAVPGIAFLSGGQSDEDATAHLSLMAAAGPLPWGLTFSYGRALQATAQKAWGGKPENVEKAQGLFTHRARMNHLASLGKWSADQEKSQP